jgi:hypothetical protein
MSHPRFTHVTSSNATQSTQTTEKTMTHPTHSLTTPAARLRSFAPAYEREAPTHPVLCALPTLDSAIAFLEGPSCASLASRPAVLRALVTFAQTTRHIVWTELLLLGYRPLLRSFVAAPETDPLEHEAEVVARFFEAVARANVRASSISVELQERTQKLLDAAALAELDWREVVLVADVSVFAVRETVPLEDLMAIRRTDQAISDATLLATFGEHGALTDLVQAHYPDVSAVVRRTLYGRLAQRRARLARVERRTRRNDGRRFS